MVLWLQDGSFLGKFLGGVGESLSECAVCWEVERFEQRWKAGGGKGKEPVE